MRKYIMSLPKPKKVYVNVDVFTSLEIGTPEYDLASKANMIFDNNKYCYLNDIMYWYSKNTKRYSVQDLADLYKAITGRRIPE